jgi:hypothetical protein
MKQCNSDEEIAKAALDAAITGIGVTNNRWDFKKDPEGSWITEAYDNLMYMFDPDTRKIDLTDCRYYTVSGFFTCDEIIAMHDNQITPEMEQLMRDRARDIEGTFKRMGMPIGWMDRVWQGAMTFLGFRDKRDEFTESLINDFIDARSGLYRIS